MGSLASCSNQGSEPSVEYIPVQIDNDGNWSFMSNKGEIVLPDEFKNSPTCVANGFFSVKEGEKYVIYKFDAKKPTVVAEELKQVGYVSDDLVPTVTEKSRITILNTKGEKVFTLDPVKNKEIIACVNAFSEGMLMVQDEDSKWGFVNTKGACVIPPKYDNAQSFSEGLAVVGETVTDSEGNESDTKYSVINKKGEVVYKIPKGFSPRGEYSYGLLKARDKNDHIVFMDKKGEVVTKCPAKVKGVYSYTDKMYVFYNEDYDCGVMTMDGETILRPKYDQITFTEDGKIVAADDDKAEIFNSKGESQFTIDDYKSVQAVHGFGLVGKDKKTYQFFDEKGQPLKNAEFSDVAMYLAPFIRIESDYFNMDAAIGALLSELTEQGYGKYKFGATAQSIKGGAASSSESYSSRLSMDDMPSGYGYHTYGTAMFSESMARYEYSPYSYSGSYYWNADSKLEGVELRLSAETTLGKEAMEVAVKVLEGKRFNKVIVTNEKSEKTFAALLTKGDITVAVMSEKDSSRLTVFVGKDPDGTGRKNLENTIRTFNNEEPLAEEVVAEEVVATDTVAVEAPSYY